MAFCIFETHESEIKKSGIFSGRWLPYKLLLGAHTKHNPWVTLQFLWLQEKSVATLR